MNPGMTLRALGAEGLPPAAEPVGIRRTSRWELQRRGLAFPPDVEVRLMALQAKERFILLKQVVRHRAMRLVANRAALFHRRMLEYERPVLCRMAVGAEGLLGFRIAEQVVARAAVRVVARRASHAPFTNGMMRRLIHLGPLVAMAVVAELGLRFLQRTFRRRR